jgi:hypothetical protein
VADFRDTNTKNESTLSRWSRLKRGQLTENTEISTNTNLPVNAHLNRATAIGADRASTSTDASRAKANADDETIAALQLPSLDSVSLDADFTPFMQAKVPDALKRQALKALFKDAHFNTMDGLDTYIDDYTKFEPLTAADLEGLSAWKSIKNPLKQVVTPGGYAVDVESEEGKAVLAAREQSDSSDSRDEIDGDEIDVVAEAEPIQVEQNAALPHARYGKRVGDFLPARENQSLEDPR